MEKVVFGVPRGRPVANIEKLLLPFRLFPWICIVFCFSAGHLLVLVLKLARAEVRQFILGRYNPHPVLSMVSIWLGNAENRLPGRNFSRFLVMMWILLAFVLRSSYQAALFDILRQKNSISPINTLQRMVDAQYVIYVSTRMEKYMRQMDAKIQPFVRVVPSTLIDNLLLQTLDINFNGAVVAAEPSIQYMNKFKVPEGQQLIKSPVAITNIQNTIYLEQTSCLQEPFNLELLRYISSGFIQSWTTKFLNREETTLDIDEFQELNLSDVLGIFQVFGMLMVGNILVFVVEICYYRWKKGKGQADNKNSIYL